MEVDGEMARLHSRIEKVENDIEKVENVIEKVENDIKKAEDIQGGDLTPEDKQYWREKERALREKERALREEELALREKELALREKENKLLDLKLKNAAGTSDSDIVISVLKDLWKQAKTFKLEQLEGYVAIPDFKILSGLSINVPCRMGLYIRKCFFDFYEKLMNAFQKHKYVHVNGTPGVGKSAFLWYVVLRAAIAGEFDVIVELGQAKSGTSAGIIFYRNGSVNYSPRFKSLKISGNGPFLHLVDQVFLGNHFGENIMIFASPDEDNTKEVFKCGGGSMCRKVMPSWRKELQEFLRLCEIELPNVERREIMDHIRVWGIIPRVVFDMMNEPAYLDQVIAKCNLELSKWWVDGSVLCKLLELEPIDAEYEICSVRFASRHLGEKYWRYYWNNKRQELMAFLKSSAGIAHLSALRGFIYENCLIASWTDTRDVVLHARSLGDGLPLHFNVGQRILRHFSSPLEIRAAHAANEDLTKILWVPRKNNPLYDGLAFPNLIVQATVADGQTSGHDVLHMALINTATLMWELNGYQKVIFLVVVPTDGVTNWKSSSLHWKNSSGEDLQKFSRMLKNIGLYVAGYDPSGLDSEDVPEDDGTVWKVLDAKERKDLVDLLPQVKKQAQKRVVQKRKASSLDACSAMGSKSTAELLPELEAQWPDDCDCDDDMAEHPLNEDEIRLEIVLQSAELSQA